MMRLTGLLIVGSSRGNDPAQRILESDLVAAALAQLYVGKQAKQRPAPICAPPARRAFKTTVPILRQTLRHIAHELVPDFLRPQMPSLHARYRLHVDRDAFGKPEVIWRHIRQCEVDHLVHRLPVIVQIGFGALSTNGETQGWTPVCR